MAGRRGSLHLLVLALAAAAGSSSSTCHAAFVASQVAGRHSHPRSSRGLVTCKAAASPADKLRGLLQSPPGGDILIMPCCYDGLTARMVEMHGFPLTFMTGFGVSAARGACVGASWWRRVE